MALFTVSYLCALMLLYALGYVALVLAGAWPTLVKSVVLMNSASEVIVSSPFPCYRCLLILVNHSVDLICGFLYTIKLPYM